MSKPGKVLKELCKKLGVRLTVKRGKKRVYKSIAVLKRQCANKKKVKKKKIKRKRRRKFGIGVTKGKYENLANKLLSNKKQNQINKEILLQAYKKYMTEKVVNLLKQGYTVLYIEALVGSIFKLNFMKMHQLTEDEYDYLIRGEEIDVKKLNKNIKTISDQIKDYRDSEAEKYALIRETPRLLEQARREARQAERQTVHQAVHQARQEERERAHQALLAEIQAHQAEGQAAHRERLGEIQAARQQRTNNLVRDSNSSFDLNVHGPYIGLGLGLAGAGGLGYLTHKFIKEQRKKQKKLTRFGKKKKRKVKRKRKKIKKKSKRRK